MTNNKNPVVYMRSSLAESQEEHIASQYFPLVHLRTRIPPSALVIPRYSALPFNLELAQDVENLGSELINSHTQHRWVADFEYYSVVEQFTPRTWTDRDFYRCGFPGPFVLKGRTNSRKHKWSTEMFVKTKNEALGLANRLANDSLIGPQGILYREYVPLVTFAVDPISGLPYTNEWRFFFYQSKMLACGYYWSSYSEAKSLGSDPGPQANNFATRVAELVAPYVNFFVLDVAERQDGGWVLIEINDGCMAGLSEVDPHKLYKNLRDALRA